MKEIGGAETLEILDELEIKYLGRKGELTAMLKGLASVSAEERPVLGALANDVKQAGLDLLEKRRKELADSRSSLHSEWRSAFGNQTGFTLSYSLW